MLFVVVFTVLGQTGLFAAGSGERSETVTVVGQGEVVAEPDLAVVTVGVQLYDQSAQTAAAQLRERMNAVVAAIRARGVAENQIQTASYSIFFERDFNATRGGVGEPAGLYSVENTVRVTITDVAMAAEVTDAAIAAGANQMYGVTFSLADPGSVDAEARRLAMSNARERAEALASAAGRTLGEVVEISEIGATGALPFQTRGLEASIAGGGVQPGSLQYVANVHVTYALR